MTDLERDASDLVRDILDAAAQALGGKDLDLWLAVNVDQTPFKTRIVALVRSHVDCVAANHTRPDARQ